MVDGGGTAPEPADFASCTAKAGVRFDDGTYLGDAWVMLTRSYEPASESDASFGLTPGSAWGYIEFEEQLQEEIAARISPRGAAWESMVIGRGQAEPTLYKGRLQDFTSRSGPPREVRVVSVLDSGARRFLVVEVD